MSDAQDRDRLIDAAENVFKRLGYQATTMGDIAAELGLRKNSLYRHVSSKAELLFLVQCRYQRLRTDGLVSIIADPSSAPVRLEMAIREHLSFECGDLSLRALDDSSVSDLRPDDRTALTELRSRYAHLFRRVLQDAAEAGVVRKDFDLVLMTRYLLGMLNQPHRWFDDGRFDREEVIELGVAMGLGALANPPDGLSVHSAPPAGALAESLAS